jgi:hypothetical protein
MSMTFTWFTNYLLEGDKLEKKEVRFRRQIKTLEILCELLRKDKFRKLFSQDLALKTYYNKRKINMTIPYPDINLIVFSTLQDILMKSLEQMKLN